MVIYGKKGVPMENIDLISSQISETKYLSQDNTYRYRPIMRFLYHKYEEAQNWLYKEEIYNAIKDYIPNYQIEDLERDLDFLVTNKNLITYQDIKNIQSIEEFKHKKYRYQMTDNAIEIERLTIYLEEMEIKVASLSPKRFEVLKKYLIELSNIDFNNQTYLKELWDRILDEFKDINQNYQDFLKKFQESKTEELLQSTIFLEYKDKMVQYLRDFIQGYLNQVEYIKEIISKFDSTFDTQLISTLVEYQKSIPTNLNQNYNYDKFTTITKNKWQNIKKWFVNSKDQSEGDKMLATTGNIITQITKYANSLIDLHGNMVKRKEEYKYLAKLFDQCPTLNECNLLSSQVFGIDKVTHFKGESKNYSDSLINSYDIPSIYIPVLPNTYKAREAKKNMLIEDKTKSKLETLKQYELQEKNKKEEVKKIIKDKLILLQEDVEMTKIQREYILDLISKYGLNSTYKQESVFGLKYKITINENKKCRMKCDDGILLMPSMTIEFEGEIYE